MWLSSNSSSLRIIAWGLIALASSRRTESLPALNQRLGRKQKMLARSLLGCRRGRSARSKHGDCVELEMTDSECWDPGWRNHHHLASNHCQLCRCSSARWRNAKTNWLQCIFVSGVIQRMSSIHQRRPAHHYQYRCHSFHTNYETGYLMD